VDVLGDAQASEIAARAGGQADFVRMPARGVACQDVGGFLISTMNVLWLRTQIIRGTTRATQTIDDPILAFWPERSFHVSP